MPGPGFPYTQLDAEQVLKQCFDESLDQLRVNAVVNVPPGGATEAKQDDQIVIETAIQAAVESIDSKTVVVDTDNVTVVSSALPTGAATEAKQDAGNTSLASIDSKIPASPSQEHITAVSPSSVRLSDGSAFYKATTPADTQPISAASLPLPTGAATEATLSSLDGKVITVDTDDVTITSSVLPTGAATEATLSSIDGKITVADTSDVTVTSSALPTGASTSALQTSGNASLTSIDGKLNSLGQKASAASVPVVIASDQSSIAVTSTETTNTLSQFIRNDYSSVNVTTGAYVQLIASTSNTYKEIEIFDSSGETLKIAYGAAASEVDQFLVVPGGNGRIRFNVPTATRISIRAVSATANTGEISVNFYG